MNKEKYVLRGRIRKNYPDIEFEGVDFIEHDKDFDILIEDTDKCGYDELFIRIDNFNGYNQKQYSYLPKVIINDKVFYKGSFNKLIYFLDKADGENTSMNDVFINAKPVKGKDKDGNRVFSRRGFSTELKIKGPELVFVKDSRFMLGGYYDVAEDVK